VAAAAGVASSQLPTGSLPATSGVSKESTTTAAGGSTTGTGGSGGNQTGLWEALTVGFTSENTGLFAGLSLLAALALAGGLAVGISALRRAGSPTATRNAVVERGERRPASAT
jgi:hypothetical protein